MFGAWCSGTPLLGVYSQSHQIAGVYLKWPLTESSTLLFTMTPSTFTPHICNNLNVLILKLKYKQF